MSTRPRDKQQIASFIDHTLLKADAVATDIVRLCDEAKEHQFASVCVNPFWMTDVAQLLKDSPVRMCTVIGFPLGASDSAVKVREAERALVEGAGELDMVQNVGALRSGRAEVVADEIRQLADLAHAGRAILKVILETCLLTDAEKHQACEIAVASGADFVKTSTGFGSAGATVGDVALMRRVVGPARGVKASGGIRSLAVLEQMVAAGANRIGTSSGVQILAEVDNMPSEAAQSGAY